MNMHVDTASVRAEQIEIVTDEARLAEIGPAWDQLWSRADGLVFQSHGWISAWWRTVPDRDRRALRIGLVWNGERLEAVMALSVHQRRGARFLEWAANSYSDYEDALVAPDCPSSAVARLWSAVTAMGGFDIALINRLQPGAQMLALQVGAVGTRLGPNYRTEVSHRVGSEGNSGLAWFDGQSKKTRQNYRRGYKAMAEFGVVKFRLLEPDEPLEPVLDRLAMLKRKWLVARGHTSALFNEDSETLRALTAVLARLGVLRVFVLELDGLMVAVSLNFVQRNTMMAFVTTYDPDYERASPGMLLINDYIMWSFDQGLGMVDFLCGAEAFKLRFATTTVVLSTLVGARSWRGRAGLVLDDLKHRRQLRRERNTVPGSGSVESD
jgi:CelD/BcsL family acetyltransferase involved in cellulose biosynthesis